MKNRIVDGRKLRRWIRGQLQACRSYCHILNNYTQLDQLKSAIKRDCRRRKLPGAKLY